MVKGTNDSPEGEKSFSTIKKAGPLMKKEEIALKFGSVQALIGKYEEISVKLKVVDTDSLSIAENHAVTLQQTLVDIETARKLMKSPYFETGKLIDSYSKTILDPLNRSKKRLTSTIASYKELQAAAERKRIQVEENERLEREKAKRLEIEKISRIKSQLIARIFGGTYTVADGTARSSAGCQTTEDCENLAKFIDEKYPKDETFTYMGQESNDVRVEMMNNLYEQKARLIAISTADDEQREKVQHEMNEKKLDASVDIIDEENTMKKQLESDIKNETREDEKSLKDAKKGLREYVKFAVVDENIVPGDFKVVEEKLVNEYIRKNGDRIKELLKKDEQPIPGLTFYVESKFIARS